MLETIITALITGGLTLVGVIYNSRKQHDTTVNSIKYEVNEVKNEFMYSIDLIKKDITNLEKKQDIHNGVIERMYAVEKTLEVLDERQKVANNRIKDLETKGE